VVAVAYIFAHPRLQTKVTATAGDHYVLASDHFARLLCHLLHKALLKLQLVCR
jgi:hypothetical protein